MECPYGVSLTMSLWSVLMECPYGVSLWSVLKEDNWLTSIHITILTNRDPQPETLTLTLNVVPYCESLTSVCIGIEKWVIY